MKSNPFIDIDLHGLTTREAMVEIENVLKKLDRSTYQIRIVHGFNNGTRIKSMIKKEYANDDRIKRIVPGDNRGITILVIRELC